MGFVLGIMKQVKDETYPSILADPGRTPNDTYNDAMSDFVTIALFHHIVMKSESPSSHTVPTARMMRIRNLTIAFCFVVVVLLYKSERLLHYVAAVIFHLT